MNAAWDECGCNCVKCQFYQRSTCQGLRRRVRAGFEGNAPKPAIVTASLTEACAKQSDPAIRRGSVAPLLPPPALRAVAHILASTHDKSTATAVVTVSTLRCIHAYNWRGVLHQGVLPARVHLPCREEDDL